jgi:hypothetical protein
MGLCSMVDNDLAMDNQKSAKSGTLKKLDESDIPFICSFQSFQDLFS